MLKLKGYRTMAGLTQIEMAEAIGLSVTGYANKEKGDRQFTFEEMLKIKQVLAKKGIAVALEDLS